MNFYNLLHTLHAPTQFGIFLLTPRHYTYCAVSGEGEKSLPPVVRLRGVFVGSFYQLFMVESYLQFTDNKMGHDTFVACRITQTSFIHSVRKRKMPRCFQYHGHQQD